MPEAINPPTKPPVTSNSGLPAVGDLQAVVPSEGGYISGGKLNQSGYAITDLTETEKSLAQSIANGLDSKGTLTEELVESVAARQGLQPLEGGKYGSNNGFDHVYLNKDGEVVILESKQLNGGFTLGKGADDVMQMSDAWVRKVLESLDKNSEAFIAISKSFDDGTLVKGIAGVDRKTGQLVIARLE